MRSSLTHSLNLNTSLDDCVFPYFRSFPTHKKGEISLFSKTLLSNITKVECDHKVFSLRNILSMAGLTASSTFLFHMSYRRVLREDEGFYYCEADNNKERLRSQPAYLLPAGTFMSST